MKNQTIQIRKCKEPAEKENTFFQQSVLEKMVKQVSIKNRFPHADEVVNMDIVHTPNTRNQFSRKNKKEKRKKPFTKRMPDP